MPYCTAADVRAMVDTALTDGEITGIIETSDAEIDRRIGVQSSSDKLVKKLSMLVTALAIRARQPQTQVIGEYREDAGDDLRVWEREIERIFILFQVLSVKGSEYKNIDESERYLCG
jgi:hypothetical protein